MNAVSLLTRSHHEKDADHHNKTSKAICPLTNTSGPEIKPLVGNLTFHSFATILTGACAAFSLVVILVLVSLHAFNYTNRVQQRQVIRIVLLVPWVSFFCFLTVWLEGAGEYLLGSLDFGCAIALSAFMLLMCDYVLASPDGYRDLLRDGMEGKEGGGMNGQGWFKRAWYMVLQFIPTSLILWVATCISLANDTYCAASNSPHFAHIWITVLRTFVTAWAVLSDLKLYKKQVVVLKPQKMLLKFAAFKGIIGLNALQTFFINILIGNNVLHPTSHLTYNDTKVGLPSLILGLEMPLFAILIFFAFPASPYYKSASPASFNPAVDDRDEDSTQVGASPEAGPLVAIIEALNISDLLSCFVRGPMRLVKEQQWRIRRHEGWSLARGGERMSGLGDEGRGEVRTERRERRHSRDGRRHSAGERRHSRDERQHSRNERRHSRDERHHSRDQRPHSRHERHHSRHERHHDEQDRRQRRGHHPERLDIQTFADIARERIEGLRQARGRGQLGLGRGGGHGFGYGRGGGGGLGRGRW